MSGDGERRRVARVLAAPRQRGRFLPAFAGVLVLAGGCLVRDNPKFIGGESESESGTDTGVESDSNNGTGTGSESSDATGEACAEGTLDCDETIPGCESDASSPEHCGSCEHVCEYAGELHECVEGGGGLCRASIELSDFEDAYVDADKPQEKLGGAAKIHIDGGEAPEFIYLDLPFLPTRPAQAEVEQLDLILSCSGQPSAIDVLRVDEPWIEAEIRWADMIGIAVPKLTSFEIVDGVTVVDLIDLLPIWVELEYGVSLRKPLNGPEGHVDCVSRESNKEDERPRVQLTISW